MTESHFIRGRPESKWHRAFEVRGINTVEGKIPMGPVFAVELDTDDYLTLSKTQKLHASMCSFSCVIM